MNADEGKLDVLMSLKRCANRSFYSNGRSKLLRVYLYA